MVERIRSCPDVARWVRRITANSIADENGCWIWQLSRDRGGYGRFRFAQAGVRRMTGAHRASWLAFIGDIPGDLVTDHLCRNTACVNPRHLELVTNQVNALRGGLKGHAGRRPGGPKGCGRHGFVDAYQHTSPDGYARWVCRICAREAQQRYRARSAA